MSSTHSDEEQHALRSGDTTPRRALSFPKLSFDRLAQFDEEEDASESEFPAKQRGTPSLAETSEELRRTLSFKTLKEADSASIRKRLWRPSQADNKDRRRPQDLDQLIAFAVESSVLYQMRVWLSEAHRLLTWIDPRWMSCFHPRFQCASCFTCPKMPHLSDSFVNSRKIRIQWSVSCLIQVSLT